MSFIPCGVGRARPSTRSRCAVRTCHPFRVISACRAPPSTPVVQSHMSSILNTNTTLVNLIWVWQPSCPTVPREYGVQHFVLVVKTFRVSSSHMSSIPCYVWLSRPSEHSRCAIAHVVNSQKQYTKLVNLSWEWQPFFPTS